MRFGVLGPLEVRTEDGRPVRVADRKVRALLADLLAHAGAVVSADRLIDDLWGVDLPADPVATLRARVSQLRRTLEDAEPGARTLVESRPPGYRLDARTDARTFADLTGRAMAEPDAASRAALLADALALWRGPAYADFNDAPFALSEIARLDELHLAAREGRAEARLDLGEAAALVAELRGLVAEHPLRERLRAAYMCALYGAGRPAEALAAYDDLRVRMRDELGLDPAPELVALQAAVLRRDPVLTGTSGNLPADVTPLIGRDEAVRELTGILARSRLVTLHGTGGVGKTRLAVAVARRHRGAWLVPLDEGPETGASVDDVASFVGGALGLRDDAGSAAGPAGRLTEALRGKRMLLVLDNCEHVAEPVARLTAGLLRDVPDLRVLATSREPLAISGERLWTVPPLGSRAAAQLFADRSGIPPGRAVTAICERLDGVPLALELAATRARTLGVDELAARLDDRFRLLSTGTRDAPARQRTLRALIDWSWEPLDERERAVLRRLAIHIGGCTLNAAEQICGADTDVFASLVDRSLVVAGDGRYRLLESVAAYCVERLHEAGEYEETRHRHAAYYTDLAERADLRG